MLAPAVPLIIGSASEKPVIAMPIAVLASPMPTRRARPVTRTLSVQEAARLLDDSEHEVLEMLKVGLLECVYSEFGRPRISEDSVREMRVLYDADRDNPLSQLFAEMDAAFSTRENLK